jgi:hypothetical protein
MSTSPSATGSTNAASGGHSRPVLRPNVEKSAQIAGPQPSMKQSGTREFQRASFLICAHLEKATNGEPHIDSGPP